MTKGRIENSAVIDLVTGKFLRRVAENPTPEEYVLMGETFTFSPTLAGHEIHIVYDEIGPEVMLLDKHMTLRP